ncbi:hypothetical protein, conserved [Plasmodium gonderi]|uniref:Uncharacterized protein n=1 Tax=Plasmodium gonderi TaxID=77519 RepID=A0A1Y1JI40_PLAGO|nr:hypothetical protein, conserved [Plasmodium gonderi]GAW82176.1 hypothetical protein, conserved [Plasmodium gonderi]
MNKGMQNSCRTLFSVFKKNVKNFAQRNKNAEYDMIKTVIRREKEVKFKNIFLGVSLINMTMFIFTLSNYFVKNEKDYYDNMDIGIIDHVALNEFISSMGVNNLPIYLKNKFFNKLVKNIQDEEYSFKENALLGLLEIFYKNKNAYAEIIRENYVEHLNLIKYIFEELQKGKNLEYTKKKIFSSILFYYIKYSDNNLSLPYDYIQELVNNPNLFHNLDQREDIISYLLLKIAKNEKNISEIYENEKEFIEMYTKRSDKMKLSISEDEMEKKKSSYMPIIQYLILQKKDRIEDDKSMWNFYYTIKKSNENYNKQECLILFQNYFDKINCSFYIETSGMTLKKNNSSNIMNKIYLKYFENTIIYTFFFSFVLHNINAKEYTMKNYLFAAKDIFRSIYTNCIINAILLIQKSVTQNMNMCTYENIGISTSFLFNVLNSLAFSFSLYKCKYALAPLLFSQIVKDNFFL